MPGFFVNLEVTCETCLLDLLSDLSLLLICSRGVGDEIFFMEIF